MKTKQKQMKKGEKAKPSVLVPEPEAEVSVVEVAPPPPEIVARAARDEANPRLVGDYHEAIRVLRDEKRFTFREIAEWLSKRFGIDADHNAVYRAYTKGMSDQDAAFESIRDEDDERDTALG